MLICKACYEKETVVSLTVVSGVSTPQAKVMLVCPVCGHRVFVTAERLEELTAVAEGVMKRV